MSIDWMPVRKIPPKAKGNRGFFPSVKVPNGIVKYESQLERDLFLLFNHASEVKKFQYQPITVPYQDANGKRHKYTPDVYVEFENGLKVLIEVKYEDEVMEVGEKYEERWSAAEEWAMQRGLLFVILTDKSIRRERWINIWFTLGASKYAGNDKFIDDLNVLIPPEGLEYNTLCFDLAELLGVELGKAAQILCYAIYHGLVFVDTFSTHELSSKTIIRKRKSPTSVPFRPLWEEFQWSTGREDKDLGKLSQSTQLTEIPLKSISSNVPDQYEDEVEKREKIVKEWLKRPSKKRTAEWRAEFEKKWDVNERTVYRWVKAYKKEKKEGLIPAHRKAGRPLKYDRDTLELMEKARIYFLNPSVTLKQAVQRLTILCKKKNIEVPNEYSFRRYYYKNTTKAERARKRGAKVYKSLFTPSLASFQGAVSPMQILQFDNTSFDVFPVDSEERLPLASPYLTAAIDPYTRMITGFYLSLHPASSLSALEVLVQSILPKEIFTGIYDTEEEWSIQGFPVLILVDNGMDYQSEDLKEFCIKYDIILEYVPLRTPRYKAFIESWFKVLHNALEEEMPLAVRPLLKRRLENPDLKPETEGVCTLQALEKWLHLWVVDKYHLTNSYDDLVLAPFLKWKDVQDGRTKLILPSPRDPPKTSQEVDYLLLSTLHRESRQLKSYGVVWEYLKYNNNELAQVFATIGEGNTVNVLLDRRDIRYIWVINPINEKPIKVGLASGWAKALLETYGDLPINSSAWVRDVKLIRSRIRGRLTPYIFKIEQSKLERAKLFNEEKKTTKRVRREREKAKESNRKSLHQRIKTTEEIASPDEPEMDVVPEIYDKFEPPEELLEGSEVVVQSNIYDTIIPESLPIARYPKKKLRGESENEED